MWNSRSHQLVGLAMSHQELVSLTDVYQLLDSECRSKQTTYILQVLWRDLTSPFDVVAQVQDHWRANLFYHVYWTFVWIQDML